MLESRDVFLCHAHADKESIVRPLASELRNFGVTYWLDEAEIRVGDRITAKVSEGLAISRYVVVFITENFIGRNWPQVELQSAVSLEAASGDVKVLPVVSVPHEIFSERFPLLRDKLYLRWEKNPDAVAKAIAERLGYEFMERCTLFFPIEYVGSVWIRFLQIAGNVGETHSYRLSWGDWQCNGFFSSPEQSVCMITSKGPDSFAVPLIVDVAPACRVDRGTGLPPCTATIDINFEWRPAPRA